LLAALVAAFGPCPPLCVSKMLKVKIAITRAKAGAVVA